MEPSARKIEPRPAKIGSGAAKNELIVAKMEPRAARIYAKRTQWRSVIPKLTKKNVK